MSKAIIIDFILYYSVLLLIGYFAYRKTKGFSDYILGGRQLGPFVGGLSTGASDMSGWLILGLPGSIYAAGLSGIWLASGLAIGAYLNWQYVGKRINVYTEVVDALTFPDFLESRFRDNTRIIKSITSIFILIFFAFYISSGLVGGALLFEQTFGIPYQTALWAGSLIIIVYTFIGGFLAAAWTDFFQGLLMFIALISVPIVAIFNLGGWSETVNLVGDININLLDVFSGTTTLGIISLLAWGLGYFGQPHIIVRFMALRSSKDIPVARTVYTYWNVLAMFGAVFVGFAGIAFFAKTPLSNPETVFIQFAKVLFNPWLTGILLVAILSAIMSTISAQLVVSASVISEDFYKGFLRKNAGQKELVMVSRCAVLAVSLLAILLAFNPESSVLSLVGYAWAGFGAAFGPAILLAVFWKGTTRNGTVAGIITGGVTVILWSTLTKHGIIPFYLYELLPGFVFSLLANYIISKIDKRPGDEIIDEYKAVESLIVNSSS